jgi:hypothetical protein
MTNYVGELGQHLDAVSSEDSTHAGVVAAAANVQAVGQEEVTYTQLVNDHIASMTGMMNGMMTCRDSQGGAPNISAMSTLMQQLRPEMDRHHTAMTTTPDLAGAQAEETLHQTTMHDLLTQMRQQRDAMMGYAGGYSCMQCNCSMM